MKTFSFLTFLILLLFAMDKNRPQETDEPEPALNMFYNLREIPVGWLGEMQSQIDFMLCGLPQKCL